MFFININLVPMYKHLSLKNIDEKKVLDDKTTI